jgi:hypothetical protein
MGGVILILYRNNYFTIVNLFYRIVILCNIDSRRSSENVRTTSWADLQTVRRCRAVDRTSTSTAKLPNCLKAYLHETGFFWTYDSKESLTRKAAHCRMTKVELFLISPYGATYWVNLRRTDDMTTYAARHKMPYGLWWSVAWRLQKCRTV